MILLHIWNNNEPEHALYLIRGRDYIINQQNMVNYESQFIPIHLPPQHCVKVYEPKSHEKFKRRNFVKSN